MLVRDAAASRLSRPLCFENSHSGALISIMCQLENSKGAERGLGVGGIV